MRSEDAGQLHDAELPDGSGMEPEDEEREEYGNELRSSANYDTACCPLCKMMGALFDGMKRVYECKWCGCVFEVRIVNWPPRVPEGFDRYRERRDPGTMREEARDSAGINDTSTLGPMYPVPASDGKGDDEE